MSKIKICLFNNIGQLQHSLCLKEIKLTLKNINWNTKNILKDVIVFTVYALFSDCIIHYQLTNNKNYLS